MTEPRASDPSDVPTPLRSAAGAVFGIAAALLLSLLGGGVHATRAHSAVSVAVADQCLPSAGDRAGDARRAVHPKGANARRPDFDSGLALAAFGFALPCAAPQTARHRAVAGAQARTSWPSTTRARAPPRA
ncbi:hypothetical protein OF829_04655 [Sphingomonas sp. LB-2]|uniref:hypothetical protein n=1 Tax=Sphingomonas caeni TaxID=2984949 RepID=UPI00222E5008|nr:hypothetical protein [Sphingomonas caeni]MCW3846518.1 hypothetical protein [Sphingomonas caeni]